MTESPQHSARESSAPENAMAAARAAARAAERRRSGRHYRRDAPASRWNRVAAVATAVAIALVGVVAATQWIRNSPTAVADAATVAIASAVVATPPSTVGNPPPVSSPSAVSSSMRTTLAGAQADGCALTGGTLTLAAAPEIAVALGSLRDRVVGGCRLSIVAQDSADFIASTRADASKLPDVWIPDSSIWVERAAAAGIAVPAGLNPVVATSAVVLALSPAAAGRVPTEPTPGLKQILQTRNSNAPVRLGLPDPTRSIPALGVLLGLRSFDTSVPTDRAALTWGIRSSPADLPTGSDQLLARLAQDPNTAVPVSEQAVWTYNRTAAAPVTAVYGVSAGLDIDYPLVILVGSTAATALLADLQTNVGRQLLLDNGFRDNTGAFSEAMSGVTGVDAGAAVNTTVPALRAIDDALQSLHAIDESTRMLAVLDVSGSMAAVVPGAGGATRLDLAKAAATLGLGLYPPDSEIGFWIFSRKLAGDTDYRELAPVGSLSAVTDGVSGTQRIAQAIDSAQVNPGGGTGLYDTALAAVRSMQASWDPSKVNVVLILSDGQNHDDGSISLPDLLNTLKTEMDPIKPVPVISIAFGPDSDIAAMDQISQATGGATYIAADPKDITDIFLDSVGQRLCRPNC